MKDKKNNIFNKFKSLNKKTKIIILSSVSILLISSVGFATYLSLNKQNQEENSQMEEKTYASITGKVINQEDKPVESATIELSAYKLEEQDNIKIITSSTDSEGKYDINEIGKGDKLLVAHKENQAALAKITIDEFKTYEIPDLKLVDSAEVRGFVYDSITNDPLKDAEVTISINGGEIELKVKTNKEGEYIIYHVPNGTQQITITKNNEKIVSEEIEINSTDTVKKSYNEPESENTATSNNTNLETSTSSYESGDEPSDSSEQSDSNSETESTPTTTQTTEESSGYSTITESKTLAGFDVTITRPNAEGQFPGILLVTGPLTAETLAQNGYYVVSKDFEWVSDACNVITAAKAESTSSNRFAITGHSWAGAMSLVAGNECSAVNVVVESGGLIDENNGILLENGEIPKPILFITGESDDLATPAATQTMYDKHTSSGNVGQIYIVPGSGHGLSEGSIISTVLSFLNSYL